MSNNLPDTKRIDRDIFKATLTKDGNIIINIFTASLPMVCYSLKLLELQIENQLIASQIQKVEKDAPIVKTASEILRQARDGRQI